MQEPLQTKLQPRHAQTKTLPLTIQGHPTQIKHSPLDPLNNERGQHKERKLPSQPWNAHDPTFEVTVHIQVLISAWRDKQYWILSGGAQQKQLTALYGGFISIKRRNTDLMRRPKTVLCGVARGGGTQRPYNMDGEIRLENGAEKGLVLCGMLLQPETQVSQELVSSYFTSMSSLK